MKCMKLLGMTFVLMALAGQELIAGAATPSTILVLPARRRMVELANQVARIKDVGLVAYNNNPASTEPLIHVWNGSEWLAISAADYATGNFMSGEPRHLILLGDSATLPEVLSANPTWCADVRRITFLDTSALLNELNKTLKFTPRQWKWLARLNGLILTDKNVERRRYGRWGNPGNEKVSAKPTSLDDIVMPPAPIHSEIKEPVKPQAPAEPPVIGPVTMEPVKAEPVKEEIKLATPAAPKVDAPPVVTSPVEPAVDSPKTPADK